MSASPPIKDRLRDPADEATLQRMWLAIGARSAQRARPRRWPPAVALAGLAGAAVAAALILFVHRDRGPLSLAGGTPVAALTAPAAGARLALSDGSSIQLAAGARFEPLESTGSTFVAILQSGDAAFEVNPGGPRRWQIECGLATVEVTGTRFSCERAPGKLRVAVQRGAVLVRGERVPDRVRRLAAGEAMEIGSGAPAAAQAVAPAVAVAAAPEVAAPAVSVPAVSGKAGESWRALATTGRHHEAFAALGEQGIRRELGRVGVSDLLALADVARLSGHPADAVAPLARILAEFAGDPQASLAAFTLGRIELDELRRPARAAAAIERALALGLPRSLTEDARARLVEAHARAGDRQAARAAAAAYARAFPGGRHAASIDAWVAGAR